MLNGFTMDGLDLGGIMSMLQPVLPMLSYFINMITKAFEIFTSYLGFDVTIPEETPEEDADAGIE